ncbi:MAG: hypothetical protein AAF222_13720, partial [Pseudomonadota bacterium]
AGQELRNTLDTLLCEQSIARSAQALVTTDQGFAPENADEVVTTCGAPISPSQFSVEVCAFPLVVSAYPSRDS